MARICPQCAQENYDQSIFCTRCGFRFLATEDVPTPAAPQNPAYSGYAAQANVAPVDGSPLGGPPPFAPLGDQAYGQQGGMRGYGAPTGDPYGAAGTPYQQQQQAFPNMPPPQQGSQYPPFAGAGQRGTGAAGMGMAQGLAVVQRAFAGKGIPLMHASWLLNSKDGKEVASAADVRSAIIGKVQQGFPNELKASQEHLSERDAVVEERDYVRIERAPANVFVYVTQFGRDLYVSRTTTVQPGFSLVRIGVFGALFVLMLITFIMSSAATAPILASLNVAGYITDLISFIQFKFAVSLISTSLFFFFIVLALRSLVRWLTEKDFLFYLRPRVLNDFRVDDGAILEHIADRSIREAVEELGLDASALSAPARNYPVKQPLF